MSISLTRLTPPFSQVWERVALKKDVDMALMMDALLTPTAPNRFIIEPWAHTNKCLCKRGICAKIVGSIMESLRERGAWLRKQTCNR